MTTPRLEIYKGQYYAVWSENRRSRRKSMKTNYKPLAENRFGRWLMERGHVDKIGDPSTLLIETLWTQYSCHHVEKKVAAPSAIYTAWRNLAPHFQFRTLAQLNQETVQEYVEARANGRIGRRARPATVRKELSVLRACLNWNAHPARGKTGLLEPRDVPVFELPDRAEPRDRWLSTEELDRLLEAAKHPSGAPITDTECFIWLALETAARRQAICDLTWGQIDFETRMIHYLVPGRKQTSKRRPSVPISDRLLPVLRQMKEQDLNSYPSAKSRSRVIGFGPISIWYLFQKAVKAAGLAPDPKARATGISPHTLRHTAATHMARRGVPLYDIAGILGISVAVAESTYAKHCPGRLRDAVNSISASTLRAPRHE